MAAASDGEICGPGDDAQFAGRSLRIPWSTSARTALVVGAAGGGKSTFARRCVRAVGGRIVQATSEWAGLDQARSRIEQACDGNPAMLAIDDAHHLIGTEAEGILESLSVEPRVERLLIVTRVLPRFNAHPAAMITVPDLALSLTDVVRLFTECGAPHIDLEMASRVRHATAGWPELVRRLAVAPAPPDESSPHFRGWNFASDFAAAWFEEFLRPLGEPLVGALEGAAALPEIDLPRAARLLGASRAASLISALDNGLVMHARTASGRRALPPVLRRHLLERMDQERRREMASEAATVLGRAGDWAAAADSLAAGELWAELSRLLEGAPESSVRALHWVDGVPSGVVRSWPAIAAVAQRACRDDRRSLSLLPPRDAEVFPVEQRDSFSIATMHAQQGDAASAVRMYRRCLLAAPTPAVRILARLALAVIRAPVAPEGATVGILTALENDALDEALEGLARVVRGAIAATCPGYDRRAVHSVIEELEARADSRGVLLVRSLDMLAHARRGDLGPIEALSVAELAESLGEMEVAAWARAAAALAAAVSAAPMTDALIFAARTAAADAGLAGPHVLVETAAALATPSPGRERRLADARRRALETGLPRVPAPLRSLHAPRLLVTERTPRLEVMCFGRFRMRVDGADADLRGVRPQAREVLRMLSLAAGAPLHRELLADLVWGNLGGASALHALHVSVSSIRRMIPGGSAGGVIVERVGETYRIAIASREDCDLASFDDRLADAANAKRSGNAVAARDGLAGALDRYVGDILPEDGPAEWVVGTRERYRLRAAEAANSLAHLHARLGDVGEAVLVARRAVEIDPWIDASWRTLIAMHSRAGDVIEVRRAEDGYRRMRQALGVD